MHALLEPLFKKLIPLFAGVVAGAWLLGLPLSFGAVASGECQTFRGKSLGNDPTQKVVFNLCRRGDRVEGVKTSEGEAGRSVYVLEGTVQGDDMVQMTITSVLEDEPAEGWISCSDDVFNLRWSDRLNALTGDYVSAECEDRATLSLERIERPVGRYSCSGS